jgi:hypothetical protein
MIRSHHLSAPGLALAVALVSLSGTPAAAQSRHPWSTADAQVRADERYLADDARQGRGVGTEGINQAADYIARAFARAGLKPGGTDGWFQPFELSPTAPALAHMSLGPQTVKNVIGILPGRGPHAGEVVVLGAHYDHLGLGTNGYIQFALDTAIGVVHNGADDNASGVVALIEIAHRLASHEPRSHRTYVFIAFTAEELGAIGSQYYVAHPVRPTDSTYAMLNFDMVGRLRGDSLITIGVGSATELPALLDSLNAPYRFALQKQPGPWGSSDQSSFYAAHIPVVFFFTNIHSDYHRYTDDWEKINVDGIAEIAAYATDVATALAIRPSRLTFVDVPQPPPPEASGRRASLGTIPDMTESPGGVRLAGVRAGTPAAEAGLQAGDILTQIGDFTIKDLNDLQHALVSLKAGDTVTIVVIRDGKRVETKATLR